MAHNEKKVFEYSYLQELVSKRTATSLEFLKSKTASRKFNIGLIDKSTLIYATLIADVKLLINSLSYKVKSIIRPTPSLMLSQTRIIM